MIYRQTPQVDDQKNDPVEDTLADERSFAQNSRRKN
jgi:hypothetical protein